MIAPVIHILIDDEGIARTINRRVKVKMIVQKLLVGGETPPAIADHYGIDLADVHAALVYYYDNQAAMDAEFARGESLIQQVGVAGAKLAAQIQQRMSSQGDHP